MSIVSDVIRSTASIIKGMRRTLAEVPRGKWTVQYPDEPVTVQPRYRGQHLLHVDENGKEKCVACYLCAAACPSDCIYIEATEDPRPYLERVGRDERYAKVYNIDYGRCIFCGYCVEACPKDAITHGYNFYAFGSSGLGPAGPHLGARRRAVLVETPRAVPPPL